MKMAYLDASTSHLDRNTRADLKVGCITGCTVAPYEYGVFVSVPPEIEGIDELKMANPEGFGQSACPEDLKTVLRFAREQGCDIVRFDSDADVVEGLPLFDE